MAIPPVEDLKEVMFETPYGRAVTLRRSFLSKKGWDYICHRFGLLGKYTSDKIVSIKIEGHNEFDKLIITAVVERDANEAPIEEQLELY